MESEISLADAGAQAQSAPAVLPLHTPDWHGRRFNCGATVIATVTGRTFDEVHKKVRRVRADRYAALAKQRGLDVAKYRAFVKDSLGRNKRIRGMDNGDMLETMKRFGFKVKAKGSGAKTPHPRGWGPKITLRAFMLDRGHMGPFIINVTGHYIAVSHGYVCDTYTQKPIPMLEYPKLGWRVVRWWKF